MRIEVGGERAVKSEEWKVKSEQRSVNRGQWTEVSEQRSVNRGQWKGVSEQWLLIANSPMFSIAPHVEGRITIRPYACVI